MTEFAAVSLVLSGLNVGIGSPKRFRIIVKAGVGYPLIVYEVPKRNFAAHPNYFPEASQAEALVGVKTNLGTLTGRTMKKLFYRVTKVVSC